MSDKRKKKKEIELVEVEYWTCKNPNHRHRTQCVAQKCIDKDGQPKRQHKRWSKAELYDMLNKKLAGENMSALARSMGMSSSNIKRLVDKAERIRWREEQTGEEYVMPHERNSSSYM